MKNYLKEKRKEKKLTQPQLAEKTNLPSYTHIQRYEYGSVVPSVEVALRLARALECKVEDLFELED
jgi:putative transcriptional regulator